MSPETGKIIETGAAALLFAATFLAGGRVHPFRTLIHDQRNIVSFGAGMSAAYVFVHLMPELHGVHRVVVESASMPLRYEGMAIYFLALLGFLVFYGLDHLRRQMREGVEEGQAGASFRLHVGGFAAYVCLMAYLLVNSLETTPVSIMLYAAAIGFHFLAVDRELRREHGAAYDRIGRFVLAGMSVLGWGVGLLLALPAPVLAMLVAFVSGAIIMNSLIMELPSEKDGRFPAFMTGGIAYGVILLPLAANTNS